MRIFLVLALRDEPKINEERVFRVTCSPDVCIFLEFEATISHLLSPPYSWWGKTGDSRWMIGDPVESEECQKPQPPLLLKKALQYTSNLYGNTPPICITVFSLPLSSQEREILQYSSHLYNSTPQ